MAVTLEDKIEGAADSAVADQVLSSMEREKVEVENVATTAPPTPAKQETVEDKKVEKAIEVEETPKDEETSGEVDGKERNSPKKVLASIRRNLTTSRKGDKKEENVEEKEAKKSEASEQLSPESPARESKEGKEKALDKFVGRIFKREDSPKDIPKVSGDIVEETAKEEVKKVEEATEPVNKPTEDKKEEKLARHNQLYDHLAKAFTSRKVSGKSSSGSSFEGQSETPKSEADKASTVAAINIRAEVKAKEYTIKAKKEEEEPSSPKMFDALKKKATEFVHNLEEKVSKEKKQQQEETQPEVREGQEGTTEVEQKKEDKSPKIQTDESSMGHFLGGVKAKIQGVMNKEPVEHKETAKVKEEGQTKTAEKKNKEGEAEVAEEEKKENLHQEAAKTKASESGANTIGSQSPKWKNRMSGLFAMPILSKKGTVEERTVTTPTAKEEAKKEVADATEEVPTTTTTNSTAAAAAAEIEAEQEKKVAAPIAGEVSKSDATTVEAAAVEATSADTTTV